MNQSPSKHSLVLFLSFLLVIGFQTISAQDKEWREVSPAELQVKTPKVEADADAEALFWEVRVDDGSSMDLVMKHYIRVKIFTERGREKFSKVEIPYFKGMKIKDIKARVIKADGSIAELAKTDVFDREIIKTNNVKIKAKSFAVPNIEPGVIFEYRYQETIPYSSAEDMRMIFQRDIPIQTISYYFKPAASTRYLTFNMADNKFIKDKSGFYRATMENVPALKEEPFMPPQDEVRSWLLLYYTRNLKSTSNDFWARLGGNIVYIYDVKDTLKPDKSLKTAATEITAGASAPEDQIAKIYQFCKTKIKNITFDTQLTEEEKEKIKPNKSTTETYKKLQGRQNDINELFASLTSALGFETRLAFGGDRSEKFFDPSQAHESFVHFAAVAVKVNGRWRYYDPGDMFSTYGMLPWHEEGTSVLLLGYKDYLTTETPLSDHSKSLAKRSGKFKLLEDGTLEGRIRVEYTGHLGYVYKLNNYESSPAKREETLKDAIKNRLSAADVSAIAVENIFDSEKPFVYQYTVRVPNYAQKTGKRLFLQPGFFEYGADPLFSSATRKHDIFFQFPWSEEDNIEIELPKGFSLDSADTPQSIADSSRISSHEVQMSIDKAANLLVYNRKFYFGGGGNILFPANAYQPVKGLFDAFHKADSHTITLRQD